MLFVKVKVRRSEHESTNVEIPVWELPVLQVVHTEELVEVLEEDLVVDRQYPDPQSEYARLEARYKKDVETDTTYVAAVYGRAPMGVKKLADAIADVRRDELARFGQPASESAEFDPAA